MHCLRAEVDVDVDQRKRVAVRSHDEAKRHEEFQNGTHAPPLPFESPARRARMAHPNAAGPRQAMAMPAPTGDLDDSRLGVAPPFGPRERTRAKSWGKMGDCA